jgi:NAD+ diphosphatase
VAEGWAVALVGTRVLLRLDGERVRLPTPEEIDEAIGLDLLEAVEVPIDVRASSGARVRSFDLPEETPFPDHFRLEGLRVAYHSLPIEQFRAAGTVRWKVVWHRTSGFCSNCGAPTRKHPLHEARVCERCDRLHFAPVQPAVIVLVQRDREALLARSPHFTPGVYSTLAGFVEPGETLEECVHREVEEEVGVTLRDPRYFGSQPHPFPHSLMVGFVADWAGGEIRIDPGEIEDARWFRSDDLPELPHPMSIAHALIRDFVERTRG